MRQSIPFSENIQAQAKWNTLTVIDGFIIIGSIGVGFVLKSFVYEPLQLFFVAFVALATTYFVYPSIDSPNKKNYQLTWMLFRKDNNVYAASRSEIKVNDHV